MATPSIERRRKEYTSSCGKCASNRFSTDGVSIMFQARNNNKHAVSSKTPKAKNGQNY